MLLAKLWDLLVEVIMRIKITNMINIVHQSFDPSTISITSAWVRIMDFPVKEFVSTSITTVKKNFQVTAVTMALHCQTIEVILRDITTYSKIKTEHN